MTKFCTCYHSARDLLGVRRLRGRTKTDCPGARVDYDRQKEVYGRRSTTPTIALAPRRTMATRSPRFEDTDPARTRREDPRAEIAPTIDSITVDRNAACGTSAPSGRSRRSSPIAPARTSRPRSRGSRLRSTPADRREGGRSPRRRLLALHARFERDKINWKISFRRTEQRDEGPGRRRDDSSPRWRTYRRREPVARGTRQGRPRSHVRSDPLSTRALQLVQLAEEQSSGDDPTTSTPTPPVGSCVRSSARAGHQIRGRSWSTVPKAWSGAIAGRT